MRFSALILAVLQARIRLASCQDTGETATTRVDSRSPKRVHVLAAVESLCPDCKRYMNDQLYPTFELLGPKVMDLQVVPFGNAAIDAKSKTVDCQHGPAECDANSYGQCAASLYPHPERYLPYLRCLDDELEMGHHDEPFPAKLFAGCARDSALDFATIKACHDDRAQAWKLQKEAAAATPKKHTYVPWIEIDGNHSTDETRDSLLDAVCRAYQAGGGSHPVCDGLATRQHDDDSVANSRPLQLCHAVLPAADETVHVAQAQ
jgi:interferon gamma-inducible protein 30